MTVKYHVNSETGRANICRAEKGKCPLKGTDGKPAEHFTDKGEAKAHGEKMLASIHGATKALKKPAKAAKEKTKKQTVEATPAQKLSQLKKELAELREEKEKTNDKKEIARINGIIRGKSIHAKRLQDADRAARPRVDDISDNSVKFYSAPKTETVAEPVKEGKTDAVAEDFLNKDRSMADNKQMLIDYVADDSNFSKIREDFDKAGYNADSSTYLRNLRNGDAGAASILRQAQKDAIAAKKDGASITVSDILIYADEAADEQNVSFGDPYRFSSSEKESDVNYDTEITEEDELPEFLKDDPDFIEDQEDEELDDEN